MFFSFDSYNILSALILSFGIQALFFLFAAGFKTDKVTDFSYSLSFIILVMVLLLQGRAFEPVQIGFALCVVAWALRLGAYLFTRILKIGKDDRFDDKRGDVVKFLAFWVLQALTVWLVMLPAAVFLGTESIPSAPLLTGAGFLLWLAGFVIEAVSDAQKFRFKSNPENRGKWIDSGLWRYSRHPNYFGETLLWWGLFLVVLPVLEGMLYLTVLGPVSITLLLLFVSGIPLLEQSADKRYGDNASYLDYKRRTSIFIPLPPGK